MIIFLVFFLLLFNEVNIFKKRKKEEVEKMLKLKSKVIVQSSIFKKLILKQVH